MSKKTSDKALSSAKSAAKKKKNNAAPESKRAILKISKHVKIIATLAALYDFNTRQVLRILGEAEDAFKRNGRLILV